MPADWQKPRCAACLRALNRVHDLQSFADRHFAEAGVPERKWLDEQRVNRTEDCGVRADGEAKRHHNGPREAGLPAELAHGMPDVPACGFHAEKMKASGRFATV